MEGGHAHCTGQSIANVSEKRIIRREKRSRKPGIKSGKDKKRM